MYNSYLKYSEWSIVEEDFKKENHMSSESIFSLGNGIFGQRGNFEEDYSGDKLEGNYIGGIFYPDKTKVGWWKVGYPRYFAKTVNCPSWIRISITIDGEILDLNKVKKINSFKRELNMKKGLQILTRKKLGFLLIQDKQKRTKGIITDGQIRRFNEKKENLFNLSAKEIMTRNPISIDKDSLAVKALSLMNEKKITSLCVHNKKNKLKTIGILHIHTLLKSSIN